MPTIQHPELGTLYIPFDADVIARFQNAGIPVFPDEGISPEQMQMESDLITRRQAEIWQNQLMMMSPTLKSVPSPNKNRLPAITDSPDLSEKLIQNYDFPYESQGWAGNAEIRQAIPNPTVNFTGDQIPSDYLLNRKLNTQNQPVQNLQTAKATPESKIALSEIAKSALNQIFAVPKPKLSDVAKAASSDVFTT